MAARAFAGPIDIPAGTADKTLRLFSEQTGIPVAFGTASAAQTRTNAVKGDLAPREAIARLLEGTGLVMTANEKSGAYTISRDPAAQPTKSPARPGASQGQIEGRVINPASGDYLENARVVVEHAQGPEGEPVAEQAG